MCDKGRVALGPAWYWRGAAAQPIMGKQSGQAAPKLRSQEKAGVSSRSLAPEMPHAAHLHLCPGLSCIRLSAVLFPEARGPRRSGAKS